MNCFWNTTRSPYCHWDTNLLVKVFPEILCHESEQGEEGPAEGVKAGVAIVWITTCFDTCEALRTESVRKKGSKGYLV